MSQATLTLHTEETLLLGKYGPRLVIHLRAELDGWYSTIGCNDTDNGGNDRWRGPYPGQISAIRNAAYFGRDFLRKRGNHKMADYLTRHYNLHDRKK